MRKGILWSRPAPRGLPTKLSTDFVDTCSLRREAAENRQYSVNKAAALAAPASSTTRRMSDRSDTATEAEPPIPIPARRLGQWSRHDRGAAGDAAGRARRLSHARRARATCSMSARRASLKKRVAAYTQLDRLPNRLQRMVAETAAMEFVTTDTEAEALLLESNLIKRLMPRYNVLLRDDKSFPYILITGDHRLPAARQASRRAQPRRASISARSPRPARSTARSTRCSAPSCCAPAPTACSPAARGPACCTRSSAARRPASAASTRRTMPRWSTRRAASWPASSREVQQRAAAAHGRRPAATLDFERAARAARPHPRADPHPGAPGRSTSPALDDADVIAAHQATAARPACRCSSSAPARTAATAPISRAMTASSTSRRGAGRLPRPVLRQQAAAAR